MDKKDARFYFIGDIIDAFRKSYREDRYYRGEKYPTHEDLFVAIVEDAVDSYEARLKDISKNEIEVYYNLDSEIQSRLDQLSFFDAKNWLNRYANVSSESRKLLVDELAKKNCIEGERVRRAITKVKDKIYELQISNVRELNEGVYHKLIENIILDGAIVSKEDCDEAIKELYGEDMTKEKLDMVRKKKAAETLMRFKELWDSPLWKEFCSTYGLLDR